MRSRTRESEKENDANYGHKNYLDLCSIQPVLICGVKEKYRSENVEAQQRGIHQKQNEKFMISKSNTVIYPKNKHTVVKKCILTTIPRRSSTYHGQ